MPNGSVRHVPVPGRPDLEGRLDEHATDGWHLDLLVLIVIVAGTLVAVWGGPPLGDHETLVAECARNMRLTGDWLLPQWLGEPFVRKPPLPYWLVAGLSYLFADAPHTGLPVTTVVARLPSAIAALGTVLLVWKLAAVMFGRLTGRVTAVMAGSCLFFLMYAANATVEMLLTFCCTWAHLHFWLSLRHPVGSSRRRVHLFFFYLAMGMGMMAKGPFPLVMVAMPIAVWWYTQRPLRMIARDGRRTLRPAAVRFVRGLWPLTRRAFTELWLIPGLVVFALTFVPWMVAVGLRHPQAWDLWNWQYLQRAQGEYGSTQTRSPFYYIPIIGGLVLPWVFLIFEAIAAPWMRRYAHQRRGLLYVGLWALVGTVIMSAMEFKKPYYMGPVIPALMVLMGPVAVRFYALPLRRVRLGWILWAVTLVAAIAGAVWGTLWLQAEYPEVATGLTCFGLAGGALLLTAGVMYLRGARWTAFGMTAATTILVFYAIWFGYGSRFASLGKVESLARVLDEQPLADEANVIWATQRPDARLNFYFGWHTDQIFNPDEIAAMFPDREAHMETLKMRVLERAEELLRGDEPVFLVLDRKDYHKARMLGLSEKVALVGEAPDPESYDHDWIVISNVGVTSATSPTGS